MPSSPVIPPWTRRAAVVLLACWCGLGLLHTAYVMVRPHGLVIRRPVELAGALGLPDPVGSRAVTEAIDLLASATATPAAGPVLVVRPMADARPFWDYLHYQLAHLSYPRRIDLVAELVAGDYVAVLAPPGVPLGPGWEPRFAGATLILYGPAGP